MDTASYERFPSQPEGTVLDDTYRLVRRIGFGGMGEVYEATHVRLPGRFAVKILLPDLLGNPEAFARFCREAEIMSELRHPNIIQIFDFNAAPDGRPYFVMEYLEGRDLEARLTQQGAMPLPAVVRIVNAVASALAAAHGHGVVHRDLKPANIFLDTVDGQTDEVVKVLDFGISQVRSTERRLSQPNHVLGTPPYMAPEQVRGAVEAVDGRADQFALGAIAYRMLTGRDAFHGQDTPALLYQIVHEDPPSLAQYLPAGWDTRPLQAVLDRALAKQPAQRWGGMMELARAFEDAAERTVSDGAAISDEPPPIRLPVVLKSVAPPPATAVPAATSLPAELPPRPAASDRPSVTWDLPSNVDRVPMTRVRASALGVVALGLAAVLIATGWYRQVRAAIPFTRENLRAWIWHPAPLEQPGADQTAPTIGVVGPAAPGAPPETATGARPGGAATDAARPAQASGPAGQPRPARTSRPAARAARHRKVLAPVATPLPAPGSVEIPAPDSRPSLSPPVPGGGPPEPTPLPAPVGAPGPGGAPGGFSIPPPADQAPARDLAPPPPADSDYAPPPPRSNSAAPPPAAPATP